MEDLESYRFIGIEAFTRDDSGFTRIIIEFVGVEVRYATEIDWRGFLGLGREQKALGICAQWPSSFKLSVVAYYDGDLLGFTATEGQVGGYDPHPDARTWNKAGSAYADSFAGQVSDLVGCDHRLVDNDVSVQRA